jgi:hypothetical protein
MTQLLCSLEHRQYEFLSLFSVCQVVTLANAAVSPLILPFGLWWCIGSWIMWRHHLLFVFERSTESGGMVCVWAYASPPEAFQNWAVHIFVG